MIEETYLRLEHSESVVCEMASRLLAAFIQNGQLTSETEESLIERSANLAIKLAQKIDAAIESDNENGGE